MKRVIKVIGTALIGILSLNANAWTIRAGLWQAEVNGWHGLYEMDDGTDIFEASIIPVVHVLGPVMADWYANEGDCESNPYINPVSGAAYYWQKSDSSWIYKGQIYLEAGKTYVFGEHGDAYNVMAIGGTEIMADYSKDGANIQTYTPETTGWYDVRFGVYNDSGRKGPARGEWGNVGFGINSKFEVDYWNKAWVVIRDPGDISFMRSIDETEQIAEIAKVVRTETGYEVMVRVLNHGYGVISGGISSEPKVVALEGTLEGFAAVDSVTTTGKDQLATLKFDWDDDSVPYITIMASGRGDTVSDGFVGCNDPMLLDDSLYAANRRTLTITEVKDGSGNLTGFDLTVADDGDGVSTNTLVAAFGSQDFGSYIGNWNTFNVIGKAEPNKEFTAHYDLPDGWGETIFHVRFFVCSDNLGPYRAQVEYLKSNGKSSIRDLGYKMDHWTKITMQFTYPVQGGDAYIGAGPDEKGYWFKYVANYNYQYVAIKGQWESWATIYKAIGVNDNVYICYGDIDFYDCNAAWWPGYTCNVLGDATIESPLYLMTTTDYGTLYSLNFREDYDDGSQIVMANYIPVVGWNGHTGLYETYSGNIYYSTINEMYTEDFEAGPEVSVGASYLPCEVASDDYAIAVPWIDTVPTVTKDDQGDYVFNCRLDTGMGSVTAHYYTDGATYDQVVTESATGPIDFAVPVRELATDKTYSYSVESSGFDVTHEVVGKDSFYVGELSVAASGDANHCGTVPGKFTISRADTYGDLVVNFSLGGTAIAGTEYVVPETTVTIADGETSVEIEIMPIDIAPMFEAKTIALTLEAGAYGLPESKTVQIALLPYINPTATHYAKMVDIEFSGYQGGAIKDFPLLVRLGDNIEGFNYNHLRADHADLKFMDFEGNVLDYEIEEWNPEGTSFVWVHVPSFCQGGRIRMFFDRAAAKPVAYDGAVWTKAGFYGVWHLDEGVNSGDSVIVDSAKRSANGKANTVSATEEGVIGYGHRISDSGRSAADGKGILIPDTNGSLDCDQYMTYSVWVKYPDAVFGYDRIGSRKTYWNENATWEICCQDSWNNYWAMRGAAESPCAQPWTVSMQNCTTWTLLHFVYDGEYSSIYVNGILAYPFELCKISPVGKMADRPLGIGNNAALNDQTWQGWVDEVRLLNRVVSADRAKADYQTVADDKFVSYSAVMKGDSIGLIIYVR